MYSPNNNSVAGASTIVPIPLPHTAIPVATALLFSKYTDTETMAGRYIMPNPIPGDNKRTTNNNKYD